MMTSGIISEMIDLRAKNEVFQHYPERKKELFETLLQELEDHALMCAAITVRKKICNHLMQEDYITSFEICS